MRVTIHKEAGKACTEDGKGVLALPSDGEVLMANWTAAGRPPSDNNPLQLGLLVGGRSYRGVSIRWWGFLLGDMGRCGARENG